MSEQFTEDQVIVLLVQFFESEFADDAAAVGDMIGPEIDDFVAGVQRLKQRLHMLD